MQMNQPSVMSTTQSGGIKAKLDPSLGLVSDSVKEEGQVDEDLHPLSDRGFTPKDDYDEFHIKRQKVKKDGKLKTLMGLIYFNTKSSKWTLVNTTTTADAYVNQYELVLQDLPPVKGRKTTNKRVNKSTNPTTFSVDVGTNLKRYPYDPSSLPEDITINPMFGTQFGQSAKPYLLKTLLVGVSDKQNNKFCEKHRPCCGHYLRVGDFVVIDASDAFYISHGVYVVGVFMLLPNNVRGCKVASVKCSYNEIQEQNGRVAQVSYIVPMKSNMQAKEFAKFTSGFAHATFVDNGAPRAVIRKEEGDHTKPWNGSPDWHWLHEIQPKLITEAMLSARKASKAKQVATREKQRQVGGKVEVKTERRMTTRTKPAQSRKARAQSVKRKKAEQSPSEESEESSSDDSSGDEGGSG